jgi:hypothetical protein
VPVMYKLTISCDLRKFFYPDAFHSQSFALFLKQISEGYNVGISACFYLIIQFFCEDREGEGACLYIYRPSIIWTDQKRCIGVYEELRDVAVVFHGRWTDKTYALVTSA